MLYTSLLGEVGANSSFCLYVVRRVQMNPFRLYDWVTTIFYVISRANIWLVSLKPRKSEHKVEFRFQTPKSFSDLLSSVNAKKNTKTLRTLLLHHLITKSPFFSKFQHRRTTKEQHMSSYNEATMFAFI